MSFSIRQSRLAGIRALASPVTRKSPTSAYAQQWLRARASTSTGQSSLSRATVLANQLKDRRDLPTIHDLYPSLVSELRSVRERVAASEVHSPLNEENFISILETLGASGRPSDLQRIDEILLDMPTVFGMEPTIDIHTAIIRALIKQGNVNTVHRWLTNMPLKHGHFSPTLEQYHMFLEACIDLSSFKFMRNLVLSMRQTGCKPTNDTFKILIRARWVMSEREGRVPHLVVFTTMLEDMKREGLRHDPSVASLLREGYVQCDCLAYAEEIESLYLSQFSDVQSPQQQERTSRNLKLSIVAQQRGVKAAITTFRSFQNEGYKITPATVKSILRHSRAIDDLRLVEAELDIKAATAHWAILINNNVRTGHLKDGLAIYEETKKEGVVPDAALVGPLIRALCRDTSVRTVEDSLDRALSIYHDLARAVPVSSSPETPNKSYLVHSAGPDADIYQSLLRGLASAPNLDRFSSTSESILSDMESRGISTNDSSIATSLIVLGMRNASDTDEALEAYHRFSSSLDEKGYSIVLNAFCKLSFPNPQQQQQQQQQQRIPIPSLGSYFEIVRGIRRSGLTLSVEVYTILLHQLGIAATSLRTLAISDPDTATTLRDQVALTTRRAHDLLTLDAAVSPDAHVWNQLMDTYQRLGCFGDCYRVWEMMYLSGRFDDYSVSIIFDACGYAGAGQIAKQVRSNLARDRYKFTLHNWNTWLECLCRLGNLNEALKVACTEMGKESGKVFPDLQSARILIKFGRKYGQEMEVKSRIERYIPDLWTSLPDDLRKPIEM